MIGYELSLNHDTKDSLAFVQEEIDKDTKCIMVINIRDVYGNVTSSEMIPVN